MHNARVLSVEISDADISGKFEAWIKLKFYSHGMALHG